MNRLTRYAPEFRDRAFQMTIEHRHEHPPRQAAIASVEGTMGGSVFVALPVLDRPCGQVP